MKIVLVKIRSLILRMSLKLLKKIDPYFVSRCLVESNFKTLKNEEQKSITHLSTVFKYNDEKVQPIIVDLGFFLDPKYLSFLFDNFSEYINHINNEELDEFKRYILSAEINSIDDFIQNLQKYIDKYYSENKSIIYYQTTLSILKFKQNLQENKNAFSPSTKKFPKNIYWPNPTDKVRSNSLYEDDILFSRRNELVTKKTPIGSIGSCFAIEIAHDLQRKGYNYIVTEENLHTNKFHNSCAKWGTHFNTSSFKQLVERVFNIKHTPKVVFTAVRDNKSFYLDPFREDIFFGTIEEYQENYWNHIQAAREALMKIKVLIITPGVNEVWRFKKCKSVLSVAPWRVAPELVEKHICTVAENIDNLQMMKNILCKFNPDLKFIVSLSPVPLHATFQGDLKHVVEANAHSKATLRCAIEEFVNNNENVYYFPSFELVSYCTNNPWHEDQRHVNKETVERIMLLFQKMYAIESEISDLADKEKLISPKKSSLVNL